MRLMGIPTSEVGYTPAMPRRRVDHEVHKGHVVALGEKMIVVAIFINVSNKNKKNKQTIAQNV